MAWPCSSLLGPHRHRPMHVSPKPQALKVFRDRLEFADHGPCRRASPVRGSAEAVVNMIVNQRLLGLADGLFDGIELLRQVETWPTLFDHGNDAPKVAFSAFEALDDLRMRLMDVFHGSHAIPRDRIEQGQVTVICLGPLRGAAN
jgi:hypothetical protein